MASNGIYALLTTKEYWIHALHHNKAYGYAHIRLVLEKSYFFFMFTLYTHMEETFDINFIANVIKQWVKLYSALAWDL